VLGLSYPLVLLEMSIINEVLKCFGVKNQYYRVKAVTLRGVITIKFSVQ